MSGSSGAWKDSRTKIGSKANYPLAVLIRGYNFLSVPDALFWRYTAFVSRNVTIRISDDAAFRARRQAAEKNTSVSRLAGEMLAGWERCHKRNCGFSPQWAVGGSSANKFFLWDLW